MAPAEPPNVSVAWEVWAGSVIAIVLATMAVVARIFARKLSAAPFWWDDATIVLALVINWGMEIIRWIMLTKYDYGRHAFYVGQANVIHFWKSFLAVQIFYFTNAAVTKTALLLLYYRIFGVSDKFRKALYVSSFAVTGYWIACVIVSIAGCHPVEKNWDKTMETGYCIDEIAFFRWNGICNLIIDFLILCLPMPMVWRLKISIKQKFVLSGIFLLGAFVCAASIVRVILFKADQIKDGTYSTVGTVTWSSLEQGLGIVCACLPTLRPLFRNMLSTRNKSDNSKSGSGGTIGTARQRSDTLSGKPWKLKDVEHASTVGFSRLRDDHLLHLSFEMEQSVYAPVKGASTTSSAGIGASDSEERVPMGILKKQTIDQQSEAGD